MMITSDSSSMHILYALQAIKIVQKRRDSADLRLAVHECRYLSMLEGAEAWSEESG